MAFDLPSGVVTLLFTDVEGSTRLLQELGDGYGDALREHRRCLRAVFAAHDGVEVDTQGDAFFVAFGRASDAVAAAEDGQRALAKGPIRVRMGLHTGEPRLSGTHSSWVMRSASLASLPTLRSATRRHCCYTRRQISSSPASVTLAAPGTR